jgi:hypothetical protein
MNAVPTKYALTPEAASSATSAGVAMPLSVITVRPAESWEEIQGRL